LAGFSDANNHATGFTPQHSIHSRRQAAVFEAQESLRPHSHKDGKLIDDAFSRFKRRYVL